MDEIRTFTDFTFDSSSRYKIRMRARKILIAALSTRKSISATKDWISMPYYHHVFDDEKKDFSRQIKYLKNYGEFISIDQLCELISGTDNISGRYYCMSFDDGFYNTYSNMMEITSSLDVPVIIYLPTNYIGTENLDPSDLVKIYRSLPNNPKRLTFLSWGDCKEMLNHNISFGSHTTSHTILSKLNYSDIEFELERSKQIIEEKLGISCEHFACPNGRINLDFDPTITTELAQKLGYRSVVTTNRGKTYQGDNLYLLKRDHVVAGWGNYQLRYFIGKG